MIIQLYFLLVEYLNPYFDFAGKCQGQDSRHLA
jgi:hypothetical protein